jgi:hypothetical protein
VLPGDVNPKQALLVTNLDFSRRLPSGVSPVSTTQGSAASTLKSTPENNQMYYVYYQQKQFLLFLINYYYP